MASTSSVGDDEEHTAQTSFSIFATSTGLIGIAAAEPWVLARMVPIHRASIRSYTATAATCGALGSLTYAGSSFQNRHYGAAATNTSTECRPHRETERFPGLKDGVILGGLATIMMLSRLPFKARSPLNAFAASTCGVAAAYTAYRITETKADQTLTRSPKAATGLESTSFTELSATVNAMLSMTAEEPMHQSAGDTVAAFWGPFGPQKGEGDNSAPGSGSRPSGQGSSLGGAPSSPGSSSKNDALTARDHQVDDGTETGSRTNYEWSSRTPIPDLEVDLERLTERRVQVAREAEFLWSWLSKEELEYYNRYFKLADSPDKRRKRRYLEILGRAHLMLWQEATAIDWAIADTKKHMSRLRSLDANGDMTWCVEKPSRGALIRPEKAERHLRDFEQNLERARAQAQEFMRHMADALLGLDEDAQNEQVYDPEKRKMVSQKEVFREARATLEHEVEKVEETQRVVKQLLIDAKRRVTE